VKIKTGVVRFSAERIQFELWWNRKLSRAVDESPLRADSNATQPFIERLGIIELRFDYDCSCVINVAPLTPLDNRMENGLSERRMVRNAKEASQQNQLNRESRFHDRLPEIDVKFTSESTGCTKICDRSWRT